MPGPGENTLLIGLLLARRSQVEPTLQPWSGTKRLLGPRLLDDDALAAVDRGRRGAGRRVLHLPDRPLAQLGHDAPEPTGHRPVDVAGQTHGRRHHDRAYEHRVDQDADREAEADLLERD